MMKYQAAIFDMDGTILNTIEDLTNALNYAMKETGHRHNYTNEDTKNFFGSGVEVALTRALAYEAGASLDSLVAVGTKDEVIPESVTKEEVERISQVYRPYYAAHAGIATKPFDGIVEMIQALKAKGIACAVVSNKPDEAVQSLVKTFFDGVFDFSLGQKASIKRKPAPDMNEECLRVLKVAREHCVYIGDSEIDVQTAQNSAMDEIAVTWGFRSADFLKTHGANEIVNDSNELFAAITK